MLSLLVGVAAGAVGMWFGKDWLTGEADAAEAALLADEATAKDYLSNLETELQQKVNEAEKAGLAEASAGLTSVLATLQAELAKLS